jgi:hypothetical protein
LPNRKLTCERRKLNQRDHIAEGINPRAPLSRAHLDAVDVRRRRTNSVIFTILVDRNEPSNFINKSIVGYPREHGLTQHPDEPTSPRQTLPTFESPNYAYTASVYLPNYPVYLAWIAESVYMDISGFHLLSQKLSV